MADASTPARCERCRRNGIALGEQFPQGDDDPPAHFVDVNRRRPNCLRQRLHGDFYRHAI